MLIRVGVDQDRALCILLHTIRATYSLMHSGKSSPNSCRNNQYAYPSLKLRFMRDAECPSFNEQSYWRYDSFVLHPSGMYKKFSLFLPPCAGRYNFFARSIKIVVLMSIDSFSSQVRRPSLKSSMRRWRRLQADLFSSSLSSIWYARPYFLTESIGKELKRPIRNSKPPAVLFPT